MLGSQPPPVHDPDEVRELAEEILGRPEFGDPPASLLGRIASWIADRFPGGDGGGGDVATGPPGGGGSGLLSLLLLVALLVLLVLVVRALLRQPRRLRSDADDEPVVEVTEHLDASGWAAAALEHEAAGRWKDGLRCRFRALLEELATRGVIDEVPGRTTGELRAEVSSAAPSAAEAFDSIADLFDAAWYGDAETGPAEAAVADARARAVLAATELVPAGATRDLGQADFDEVGS